MPFSPVDPARVDAVIKAYDVRGLVPEQLDEELAYSLGAAFAVVADAPAIVVGYDMRPSSPGLARRFADGVTEAGVDVTVIGLASTDQLYFASGHLDRPGAMFTASHNPAAYNGVKLCREQARPIGGDSGLSEIRDLVVAGELPTAAHPGRLEERDVLDAYAAHLLSLAPITGRPLRIVVDAGNGMAGHTVPAVIAQLPSGQIDLVPLFFDLDGTFPNHEANPIDPATLVDLRQAVIEHGADLGLAFDGDADRCFLVDETGALIGPSALTALIASRELARHPGGTVIHNLITSRSVPELVEEAGGTAVRTRVGHSFIKAQMAETGAIFGGEHSGHFYFRDFWNADSGMLAALHALSALGESERPASELMADFERYCLSGEINSTVADPQRIVERLESEYADDEAVVIDHLDGLSVRHPDWAFNVRRSNTEPLLRLNVEGRDEPTMRRVTAAILDRIRSES